MCFQRESEGGFSAGMAAIARSQRPLCLGFGGDVDKPAPFLASSEHYCAVYECIDGMVFAHAHIKAGMVNSAALALDDIACLSLLATENFYSESFRLRLTAVLRTTYTFFMCHFSLSFRFVD